MWLIGWVPNRFEKKKKKDKDKVAEHEKIRESWKNANTTKCCSIWLGFVNGQDRHCHLDFSRVCFCWCPLPFSRGAESGFIIYQGPPPLFTNATTEAVPGSVRHLLPSLLISHLSEWRPNLWTMDRPNQTNLKFKWNAYLQTQGSLEVVSNLVIWWFGGLVIACA